MKTLEADVRWSGAYVRDELGVELATVPGDSVLPVEALVGLALRRNPKRAHLLVSRVLAKHVPTEPGIVTAAGQLLALLVRQELQDAAVPPAPLQAVIGLAAARLADLLATVPASNESSTPDAGGTPQEAARGRETRISAAAGLCGLLDRQRTGFPEAVTIGYAETATGLGQLVAGQLGTYYIHSTRHTSEGEPVAAYGAFEEEHSHATSHQLLPTSRAALNQADTVVLVDDELSTGATIVNTIRELHATAPHRRYVIASLVDLRTAADRGILDALAVELGARVSTVALANGSIHLPGTLATDAADLIARLPATGSTGTGNRAPGDPFTGPGQLQVLDLNGAVAPIRSARFGVAGQPDPQPAAGIADAVAAALGAPVAPGHRLLVLATEEFMALPLAVAARLQQLRPDLDIRYSTSTRSPIAALDEPGYAVRSAVAFAGSDEGPDGAGPRFAYNFAHPEGRFDTVVIMPEPGTPAAALTAPGRIAAAVADTGAAVTLVLLPRQAPFPAPLAGPVFGSYAPQDVQWLLKDLASAQLEAPRAEREAAIQSGRASYAESLPEEFEPSPEYQALYQTALDGSAARIAHAVGMLTEQVLKLRGGTPVLVSLARAGTPVGILMKRWAQEVHGLVLPHYAVSIVRGLGIDQTALGYLAAKHDPGQVMFVDGWTGKGAIARELAAAVELFGKAAGAQFRPDLAVLADPGHSVRVFGTREDYLIPSACLNSTVSGLVSRTVYNQDLIRPGDFHGAKFYAHLAGSDVSNQFLETVTAEFSGVRDQVLAAAVGFPTDIAALPVADWSGWAAVEEISRRFGINNVNLIKPGVGETTRVLLRRVPWKVLVNSGAIGGIAHVLHLAEERGVEVLEVPELPYSCVGLIHPLHLPGRAGTAGTTAVMDV